MFVLIVDYQDENKGRPERRPKLFLLMEGEL
jgi:hypothetical protein